MMQKASVNQTYAIFSIAMFKALFDVYFEAYLNTSLFDSFYNYLGIPNPRLTNMAPDPDVGSIVNFSVGVIIAFILAMIATLIGSNLIGPVATAIGGALKNGNLTGAANSLTAQVTLIFVTVVIVGIVTFLALFGGLASKATAAA